MLDSRLRGNERGLLGTPRRIRELGMGHYDGNAAAVRDLVRIQRRVGGFNDGWAVPRRIVESILRSALLAARSKSRA
jgi:hypothetical protein